MSMEFGEWRRQEDSYNVSRLLWRMEIAMAALQEIANTDYRGNQPQEARIASEALRKIAETYR